MMHLKCDHENERSIQIDWTAYEKTRTSRGQVPWKEVEEFQIIFIFRLVGFIAFVWMDRMVVASVNIFFRVAHYARVGNI